MVTALKAHGIYKAVNLDLGIHPEEGSRILRKQEGFEDFFVNFGTVDVSRFEAPDFETQVVHSLEDGVKNYGMQSIKLWKPIGLGYQDKAGNYLRPADPRFYRFHELMQMQENMIAAHPDTTFIIAHFGSYSENLNQVG